MMTRSKIFFFISIFLLMFACVLPGQQTASLPTVTPDTRLENMVALTVSAALEQTQQAVPTETPPPTSTPQPTATSTPEADASSSLLTKNEDGSITFIDFLGKYQFTVPSELRAMRINQQEFLDAWLLPEASNPAVQNQLNLIQKQDPNRFRLFAFDFNEEHFDGGFITNINFLWDDIGEISLQDDSELVEIANSYAESLPNSEVLETKINSYENGVTVGIITSKMPATTLDGANVVIIQKQVFFDLPVGTLIATISTTETWQENTERLFDEILKTFIIID